MSGCYPFLFLVGPRGRPGLYIPRNHVGKQARTEILVHEFVLVYTKSGTLSQFKIMSGSSHRTTTFRPLHVQRSPDDDMGRPPSSPHTTVRLSNQD